jgi:hypothetical protein
MTLPIFQVDQSPSNKGHLSGNQRQLAAAADQVSCTGSWKSWKSLAAYPVMGIADSLAVTASRACLQGLHAFRFCCAAKHRSNAKIAGTLPQQQKTHSSTCKLKQTARKEGQSAMATAQEQDAMIAINIEHTAGDTDRSSLEQLRPSQSIAQFKRCAPLPLDFAEP